LFTVPWRDHTLIGVWHKLFRDPPDTAHVEEDELARWLDEINSGNPGLQLKRDEIIFTHSGLVPFGNEGETGELSFGKESRIIDHRTEHGIEGIVTLIGIRFTTARGDAGTALDVLLRQLPRAPARFATDRTPLVGGDIADLTTLNADLQREYSGQIATPVLEAAVRNHGSRCRELLEYARLTGELERIGNTDTLLAEVTHAVREEMAIHLDDVILRRTNLGAGAHPGALALARVAARMQLLRGWSERQCREQLDATTRTLERHLAGHTATDAVAA
jgi:glycerol-3-phosphate dehydrogenase